MSIVPPEARKRHQTLGMAEHELRRIRAAHASLRGRLRVERNAATKSVHDLTVSRDEWKAIAATQSQTIADLTIQLEDLKAAHEALRSRWLTLQARIPPP